MKLPRIIRKPADAASARRSIRGAVIMMALSSLMLLLVPAAAWAAPRNDDLSPFIMLALTLGGLSLLPFAVMTLTSFLRIVVVLSFLRSGLGAQNVPPNMVIIALSLFLSLFVMGPTLDQINAQSYVPYKAGKISSEQAINRAQQPLKVFMANQLGAKSSKELGTFLSLARKEQGATDVPTNAQLKARGKDAIASLPIRVIVPAFIISELKKAFIMGFAVLLPFLVIDMVISNILLSLGMFMLPPVVISLPFKILLFVIAGGWTLVVETLVTGFNY